MLCLKFIVIISHRNSYCLRKQSEFWLHESVPRPVISASLWCRNNGNLSGQNNGNTTGLGCRRSVSRAGSVFSLLFHSPLNASVLSSALRPPPMKNTHKSKLCDVLLAPTPSSLCPVLCKAKWTQYSRRLNIRHIKYDFLFITATSSVVTNFRLARP